MTEQNNNSIINQFFEFIREVNNLAGEHFRLFRHELAENTHKAVKAVILIIISVVTGYVGLIFAGFLAITLLSMIMPYWIATLLVTALYFAIPLVLLFIAVNLISDIFKKPKKSVQELEKTGEEAKKWLKNMEK